MPNNDDDAIDFCSIETLHEGDANQWAIGVTKYTIDRILRLKEHRADALALYLFYAYTARWQKTSVIRATNTYVAEGLDWGVGKVTQVKKALEQLDLIQAATTREQGRVTEWRVRIRFVQRVDPTYQNSILPLLEESGASKELTGRRKKEKTDKEILVFDDEELQREWDSFIEHRRQAGTPLTQIARGRLIAKLNKWGTQGAIAALRQSMEHSWRGVWLPKDSKAKLPMKTRNEKINELNRRKAQLMRMKRTEDVSRELVQIDIQLMKL